MRVLNFPASSSCRPLLRILHSPARNPFNPPHLQVSLDRDRNHVVTYYLILSNHARHASPQATSLRDLCVLRVSALDSSSLGLTLNLQSEVRRLSRPEIPTRSGLSTFNRVSFLSPSSPHLCALCGENSFSFRSPLIPRHSPLATNSFIIRTSKTPLPQLLYNPHLQVPLGSAGNKGLITPLESALTSTAENKGLITPLESALTKNSPVSLLESALTKRWGVGGRPHGVALPFQLLTVNCQLSFGDSGPLGTVHSIHGDPAH